MKKFFRENPTIAFGLGLPLLIVIVFLIVSGIPSLLVAPPKYDVLYVTDYNNHLTNVQIVVVERKVQVVYQNIESSNRRPRLWRYKADTGAVQEIPIILPAEIAATEAESTNSAPKSKSTVIDIPDLRALTVDSSSIAPDGYEFKGRRGRFSRNIFGGLFYSSRYYDEAVLTKDGRSISLPNINDRYYGRNTQFIGWILPQ